MKHSFVETPYGKSFIAVDSGKIASLLFLGFEAEKFLNIFFKKFPSSVETNDAELQKIADDIFIKKLGRKYCDKISLHGTDFQKKVWMELLKVNDVMSYQDLAERIGMKSAVRATASAVGKNPIHYLIPCHLIIRSTGDVGKFAAGVELKKRLIEEHRASTK